jgi:hypothetical protein
VSEQKSEIPESLITIEETRAFWREAAQKVVQDALPALESAASQCLTVNAILIGFYFNAAAFLQGKITAPSIIKLLLPLISWFISIIFALSVFLPRAYAINIQSSTGSKDFIERIIKTKHKWLKLSYLFLLIGISLLFWVVFDYLSGKIQLGTSR